MHTFGSWFRAFVVIAVPWCFAACSDPEADCADEPGGCPKDAALPVDAARDAGGDGGVATSDAGVMEDPEGLFDELPLDWPAVAAESDVATELEGLAGTEGDTMYDCRRTQHDVQRNFESILGLGDAVADARPGMVLQGARFSEGVIAAVPLRRRALSLSIDLAIPKPVREVAEPHSASIQTAIASLQRDADSELGDLPDLPARIAYTSEMSSSFEATRIAFDVHAAYAAPLVSAGFGLEWSEGRSRRATTVVAKLYQPMYTITFADDRHPTAIDFFAEDIATDEVRAQFEAGTIGEDNLPVYVKSVTYGRIVLFTMTSEEVASSSDLALLLRGSFSGFSGDTSLRARYEEIASRASIRVLALGGSAELAATAIRTADYGLFFSPARASTAVPLTYRVNYLRGARRTALLGDLLTYVAEDCEYRTRGTESYRLSGVVTEAAGGTAPWNTGFTVMSGDTIHVSATGSIWAGVFATGCNGAEGWADLAGGDFPLPGARVYSLIARAGGGPWRYVGSSATFDSATLGTGVLEFGTNDNRPGNGDGCAGASLHDFHVDARVDRPVWR